LGLPAKTEEIDQAGEPFGLPFKPYSSSEEIHLLAA